MSEISDPFPALSALPGIGAQVPTRARTGITAASRIRLVKCAFAASVLGAAVYGLIAERGYIASNNAVVSANVVSVRVPIDGYVSHLNVLVGSSVVKGSGMAHVENSRVNDQQLMDLRYAIERDRIEAESGIGVRDRLLQERRALQNRDRSYFAASVSRLLQLQDQQEHLVDAKDAVAAESHLQLVRALNLHQGGIVAQADLDRSQRMYDVAEDDARAERSGLSAMRSQADAARHGILLDSGTNGGSYSQQRIDDIDIHLAETNRIITQNLLEGRASQASLTEVSSRLDLMRSAELFAPVNGVVWKLSSTDGEHVATGDTVAQFVDCKSSFLVAAIPQERVPDILIGGLARFRLSGEKADRFGKVLSVTGERDQMHDQSLAAAPAHERNPTATVYVSDVDTSSQKQCMVGRTARVLLPVSHSSLLAQIRKLAR